MAEKIQHVGLASSKGREDGRPNLCRIFATHGFAVFGFDQFQSHRFYARAKVQRLHVQRKRRQFQGPASWLGRSLGIHSSDSDGGNFSRKSDACLRTSSQSKKASG